jgi:transposase
MAAAAAARYVAQGMSYRAAAAKAGVTLSTCQAACKRMGISSRNPVGAPRKTA